MTASRLIEVAHHSYLPFTSQSPTPPTSSTTDTSPSSGWTSSVLDVGAGTGAVTITFATLYPNIPILATDVSSEMLSQLTAAIPPYITNIKTQVVDGLELSRTLSLGTTYSHIFCTFVLHCTTRPLDLLQQLHTVLRPNGILSVAIWRPPLDLYTVWQRTCRTYEPEYTVPNASEDPNCWTTEQELAEGMAQVKFKDITTERMEMPQRFDSAEKFADFWFHSKSPVIVPVVEAFLEKGRDYAELRGIVERIVREDYQDGKGLKLRANLAWGRK